MAIGRLSMKVGKAGKAGPHAAYLVRQGEYAHRLGQGEALEAAEAGNLPTWAQFDPLAFWQAADAFERANGTTYREMEIALPRELTPEQRAALVRAFVRQEIGERHAYQWAIHVPPAADGQAQPHVHLMFSERQCDGLARDPEQYFKRYNAKAPARGGARKGYGPRAGQTLTPAERAAELKALRGRWEALCNQHLAQAGRVERIDMRSHAERGTGLEPEAKQLPSQWRNPAQRANVIEFRAARRELAEARTELGQAVPDARAEVLTLEAEQQRRAQRQAAAGQAERDRQRLARLSAAELGQAIARLRPPPVRERVERDPAVIEADQARQALQARHEAAQARETQARHEAAQWRQTHPLWAKAHDTGLFRSAYLDARTRIETEARQEHLTVARPLEDATLKEQQARREAKARITREQAPLLAKVAELEALRQEKARQERAQALHARAEKARKADLAKAVVLAARLYRQGTLAVSSDEVRRVLEQISAIKGGEGVRQMHVRQALDEPQKARALQAVVQHLAPQLEPHRARTRPRDRGPSL